MTKPWYLPNTHYVYANIFIQRDYIYSQRQVHININHWDMTEYDVRQPSGVLKYIFTIIISQWYYVWYDWLIN